MVAYPMTGHHHFSRHRKPRRRIWNVDGNRVRQGYELRAIRYVLYVSMALAVISLTLTLAFFSS